MTKQKTVIIHTDGACSGNPGPGGWGALLEYSPHVIDRFKGEDTGTPVELTLIDLNIDPDERTV